MKRLLVLLVLTACLLCGQVSSFVGDNSDFKVSSPVSVWAGFRNNTDTTEVATAGTRYVLRGTFTNQLHGFDFGTTGIRYLGKDSLEVYIFATLTAKTDAPNVVLTVGVEHRNSSGTVLDYSSYDMDLESADVTSNVVIIGKPKIGYHDELVFYVSADKACTVTVTDIRTKLEPWRFYDGN